MIKTGLADDRRHYAEKFGRGKGRVPRCSLRCAQHRTRLNSTVFFEFLKRLLEQTKGKPYLIVDGHAATIRLMPQHDAHEVMRGSVAGQRPERFAIADVRAALGAGFRTFRAIPGPSMAFAALFVAIGLGLLLAIGRFGMSPMALPLAGGFMLVAPALLTGFFALADAHETGQAPGLRDALSGFTRAPASLWVVALLCAFLFLIWITDAAILYAFMIGGEHLPYELPWLIALRRNVLAFEAWAAPMGAALAFLIFAVSAFSVPLLHERRAGLAQAVSASVRAVFGNLPASLAWGLVLAGVTLLSVLLLPLLTVTLPVLAYAGHSLYGRVFPSAARAAGAG
jgi:uncharacterized membrane protein